MAYNLEFTEYGYSTYDEAVNYVLFRVGGFGNAWAAQGLLRSIDKTLDQIRFFGTSFSFCEDPELRQLGLRIAHLNRYRYKIIFHIDGDTAYIDAIFHNLQDYESILKQYKNVA